MPKTKFRRQSAVELLYTESRFEAHSWAQRHNQACRQPAKMEYGIVQGLIAWIRYARDHQERYESHIGDDGFLGPLWLDMGKSLRGMLNGECGRLDCGTLDGAILNFAKENGFGEESF